jgi:hypothetical protein
MGDIMKDVTGIAMAIIGVAILTVILRPQSQTVQVLSTAAQGFSGVLGTAMGGGGMGGMMGMSSPMMSSSGMMVP